jgi:NodT family efflux transporter outer membrane factor (OMF) lipoprotein
MKRQTSFSTTALATAAAVLMSACASLPGGSLAPLAAEKTPPQAASLAPANFDVASSIGPLLAAPHQGSGAALASWWAAFNDPLLDRLIAAAQAASPQLSGALARVEGARAAQAAARQSLRPSVGASVGASRADSGQGPSSNVQGGVQASWELDLWGANKAGVRSANAQLSSAQTDWHEARVLVASEVASAYFAYVQCERHVRLAEADQASREATLKLNSTLEGAGLLAPAQTALARASVAEGLNRLIARRNACNQLADALVALTDLPAIKTSLSASVLAKNSPLPSTNIGSTATYSIAPALSIPHLKISQIPADVLRQRPDVLRAEFALAQAAASIVQTQAADKPRLSLGGSIGVFGVRAGGMNNDGLTWSFGPLQLTIPLLTGNVGELRDNAAEAAYAAQISALRATVRNAVRETQAALNDVATSAERLALTQRAARDYRVVLDATTARHRAGLATTLELEETRRLANLADSALIDAQADQLNAHINLYRAAGGGFDASQLAQTPVFSQSATAAPITSQ